MTAVGHWTSSESFLTVSGLFLLSGSVEGKQCLIMAFLDCRMTLRRTGNLYHHQTCQTHVPWIIMWCESYAPLFLNIFSVLCWCFWQQWRILEVIRYIINKYCICVIQWIKYIYVHFQGLTNQPSIVSPGFRRYKLNEITSFPFRYKRSLFLSKNPESLKKKEKPWNCEIMIFLATTHASSYKLNHTQ